MQEHEDKIDAILSDDSLDDYQRAWAIEDELEAERQAELGTALLVLSKNQSGDS